MSDSEVPLTIGDAARQLRSGELSSVELTETCIAQTDRLDARLGTFLTRFDDSARAAAAAADAELRAGIDRGLLHGIPIAVKDILAQAEGPTTAQSLVLDPNWAAGRDAPVVARLKAAGAVLTGKVTTMEFAVGIPDPTKPFPLPRNPWDADRWTGGSSSGTANGIAAGMFLAGIGTDTGGSIRMPAAFCGTTGLMPTFGRVPKSGCVPLGYSLDHVGPLGRSVTDCAAVLEVIAGRDAGDPDCVVRAVPNFSTAATGDLRGIRIGIERAHHPLDSGDPAVPGCFATALEVLASLGATFVEIVIPHYREVVTAASVTLSCEAMAYHRADLATRWHDFGAMTRLYLAGASLYSGPDYVQAQRVRRLGQVELARLFTEVDLIVTPTATIGAPRLEHLTEEFLGVFESSVYTPYWDAVGNPALALPMGFTDGGLPLSIHLAARPFDEELLVRAGHAFQSRTDWHRHVAPLVVAATEGGR